jgi:calcium-dependent protein kinase
MMSSSLSEDEIDTLKRTFKELDLDGDGTLTLQELQRAIKADPSLGTSAAEIERLMQVADLDGDGKLSYEELMLTCVQRKLNAKEERIWEAFCKLDLNGDGKLTVDEIQQVLKTDRAGALSFIGEVDEDNDGEVDYAEL